MATPTLRSRPTDTDDLVVLTVRDKEDLLARYGPALSSTGLFYHCETVMPVGALVTVEFRVPSGAALMAASARVIHARPAIAPGDPTAGFALEILDLDPAGRALVDSLRLSPPSKDAPPERRESLTRPPAAGASGGGPIVGIDLGTTYSCIAVVHEGAPTVLATTDGHETIPSVVYVAPDGSVAVGHRAYAKMVLEPGRCIYGAKRFLGRRFASREVHAFGHFFHYGLAAAPSGLTAAKVGDTVIALEVVAAQILKHLLGHAQLRLGEAVSRAIITVPAYFGETQRQAVLEAGRLAGLTVERLLNEPTAAAVAYGYSKAVDRKVLVYDFGGGTFDATVMHVQGDTMEVLATDGDPFLGGADIDDRLTEYALSLLERLHGQDVRGDASAVQRLRFAAEEAKCQLSDAKQATISVPHLMVGSNPPFDVAIPIDRDLFERLIEDLVQRTLAIVQRVLDSAKLAGAALDDIVMVGGQSRSPIIRRVLTEHFGKQPTRGAHPDHAIAIGAAIVAGARDTAAPIILKDILAKSIRMALPGGTTEVLLAAGSALPAEKTFPATTGESQEFRITLLRGEAAAAAENELLGEVSLPSSLSLLVAKTPANVTLTIDHDGLLTVSVEHPLTLRVDKLRVSLPEGVPEAEVTDIVDLMPEG